ncbi:ESPR-type extended signal peptide-containing protein [Cupriavidus malaysiensis]|uniref:Adhesin n=2 Tax=Pseudomonadota TaxID=1224 RepID=A0ABN4TIE4_9BURK|nr:ESPR-type extended signal peptide-containing protein [Cupriavidus malaysiensis]AOZ05180.1 hypothetical protein BKK80_04565 [Cupriavidus malaysiensis]
MNKSYKIIWSEAQNGWAVASEITAGRGKCKGGRAAVRRSRAAGLAAGGLMLAAGSAQAAPASDQLIQIRPGLDAGASSVKPAQARDPGDMAIGASSVAQSSTPSGSGDPNFWHAATAVGYGSHAIGDRTSAFGLQADASAEHATSIGAQSKAVGKTSTALGARAQASGDSAIAAGADARASGYRSVSIGTRSSATADSTLSLGNDAAALAAYSAAMGNQATATGRNSVALGAKSVADRADTISVGTDSYKRQITNVKAGVQETDAVNVAQLSEVAVLAAQGNRYFKAQGLSDGSDDAQASALRAVAIGAGAHANATNTVALGAGSVADRDNSVSVGTQGQQRQITNLAAGSSRTDAVNVGQLNDAIQNVTGGGNNSIADAVMYDDAASHASVTLKRNGGGSVALRNIAAGTADTDAVNLKQLTDAGLKVDGNGNVKGAFVAYDSETKDLVTLAGAKGGTTITNLKAGKADLDAVNIRQLKDAGLLTEDPVTGDQVGLAVSYDNGNRDDITLKGKTGTIIHNVASGKAQHDAVNVLQMQQAGVLGDDGVANQVVLFNGANGEANAAGKKLINLSKGESDTDAVTVKQLKDAVASGMVEPTKLDFLAVNSKGGSPVAVAKGYDGIALGTDAQVAERATNGIAIGAGASADGSNSVALGAGANTAGRQNVVSVGSITTSTNPSIPPVEDTRQIIHVAAGTQATDAVNVSQLTGVTQALGGGAGIDSATGKLNAPKYTIGGKDYSNVGDALQAASTAGGANPLAVSYDDDTKAKITLNSGGSAAAITNVANGRSASDAVNLAQLKDTVSTLGGGATIDAEGKVKAPTYTVKGLDGKDGTYSDVGSAVDALNANMSNIAPNLKYMKFGVSDAAQAQASGTDAVAIGGNAFAMGEHASAIGRNARAQGDDAVAIGYRANASADRATAIGIGSVAVQTGSVALGANSVADQVNVVSVGSSSNARRIINVADGVGENDAVNLGQVNSLLKGIKPNPENYSTLSAETRAALPPLDKLIAIGSTNKLEGTEAQGAEALAIGLNAKATADSAVAIGSNVTSGQAGSVGIGQNVSTGGTNSIAIGSVATSAGKSAVSIGYRASIDGDSSVGIGDTVAIAGDKNVAIGSRIAGTATNSIILGDSSDANVSNVMSIGAKGNERRIIHVAKGTGGTDAVNVDQLNEAIKSVPTNALAVSYDDDKKSKITFNKGGEATTLTNVATAKNDTDAVNLKLLKDAGMDFGNNGEVKGGVVTYDDSTKTKVTFNSGGSATTLSNVAAGVSENDAVNVKQLTDAGLDVGTGGKVNNKVVTYDDSTQTKVTLGGKDATTAVQLTNVATAKNDSDAVNLKLLKDAGMDFGSNGEVKGGVVTYDDSTKTKVTFNSGGSATTLSNVAAGVSENDAVNVKQLTDAGLDVGTGGKVNNKVVTYDDSTQTKVTLGGKDATTAVQLTNVATAKNDSDAVNLKLLKDAGMDFGSNGEVKGGVVTYDDSTKTKVTFNKGGSATTLSNVAKGVDGSDAVNVDQLNDAIKSAPGSALSVAYDDSNKTKVTLNKGGAATTLTNVAAAKADSDAVNLKLLKDAGMDFGSNGEVKGGVVTYDDSTKTKVTFNSGGSATTLSNVAAGSLDNDAVNLKQLNTGMGHVAAALGGGAAADGKGGLSSPSYIINDANGNAHTYQDVGSALSAVTESMQGIAPNLKYMKFGPSDAAQAQATGTDAVAIGGNAFAMGNQALSVGRNARSQGDQAMAMGYRANASGDRALALGYGAVAAQDDAIAVGFGSVAMEKNTFAVGGTSNLRRIVNVAEGTGDTDAVNLGQVNRLLADLNTAPAKESRMLSAESSAKPEQLIMAGPTNKQNETSATHRDTIAVGLSARANAEEAAAFGYSVSVGGKGSVGVGSKLAVDGTNSVVIGQGGSSSADEVVAIGAKAAGNAVRSVVIGYNSSTRDTATDTVLIGSNLINAEGKNSVVLGANSNGALDNVISVGAKGNERRMVFLAAGTGDTDAVNVSQLKGVTKALGGGAELNADGSVKSPTYNIGGKTYTDVGSALAAAANSGGSGGGGTDPLSVLYDNDQRTTLTLNKGGSATTLTNVAAGKADSDAVNMKQLKDLGVTIDGDGNATNAFVAYDDASKEHVTFNKGGKASVLSNVAAGRSDGDAVNLKQLTDAGLTFDDTGKSTNTFVAYDDKGKGSVTFNKGGDATKLKNVSAGKDETDAVNVKQMNDAIRASAGTGDPLGVMYDDDTKEALTLAGTKGKGTKIRNLAAGTEDTDAINLKQLKDAGLLGTDGKTSLAVTYSDDKRQAVYFGNLGGAPVLLSNVADGKISEGSTQAVNGGQLFSLTKRVDTLESITGGGNGGGTGGGNGGGTGGGTGGGSSGTGSNGLFAAHGDASTEGAVATGTHSTASGANANATGMHATATGANSVASATKSTAIGHGSTAKAENSVAIGAGAVADRANTVSFGSAGNERELTNIASVDPTVAANAMSAVNATTMNSAIARSAADTLQSANQYTDQAVSGLNTRIDGMDRTLSRGIAAAAALNNVTPYLPGRTSLNAGIAAYRGHPAVAITVSRWNSKGNINLNAGVSSAGGNSTIVRAGVGVVFGQ